VFGGLFEIGPDNGLGQLSLGQVLGFITMVLKKPKTQFWYITTVLVYDHSSQTLNRSKQLSVHCRLFRVFETTETSSFPKNGDQPFSDFEVNLKTRIGGSL